MKELTRAHFNNIMTSYAVVHTPSTLYDELEPYLKDTPERRGHTVQVTDWLIVHFQVDDLPTYKAWNGNWVEDRRKRE